MTNKLKYVIVVILAIAVGCAFFSTTDGGDFDCYLQAARQLVNHQNIYKPPFVKDLQYFYSVLFALILSPFGKHIFITEFIWLILS